MHDVNAAVKRQIKLLEHQQKRRRQVWKERCAEVHDVFERKQLEINNLKALLHHTE